MHLTLKEKFTVSSYDLNPTGSARFTSMANKFQEIAYHHAGLLGFGYEDLKAKNSMWILSRMKISMKRYPEWDEQFYIETWPSGVEKLFAMRDFRVSDEQEREIGFASTAWLILNTESRRPQRPSQELEEYRTRNNPVYESTMQKLMLPEKLEKLVDRPVVWSDLDIVGHVNNVKYMEWCIDALVGGMITEEEIRDFEINFLSESVLGDVIEIFASPDEEGQRFLSGRGVRDHTEKFRVALEWDYKEESS